MSLLTRLGKLTPSKPRSKKTDPEKVGGAEGATARGRITVGPAGSKGTATVVTPDQRSSGRQPDTSPQVEEKSHPRQGALEIATSTGFNGPDTKETSTATSIAPQNTPSQLQKSKAEDHRPVNEADLIANLDQSGRIATLDSDKEKGQHEGYDERLKNVVEMKGRVDKDTKSSNEQLKRNEEEYPRNYATKGR